ncbi:MAG TPA: tryptophan 2,3-dioxygenase family protein [Flavobacteriales bacterium]|nr:tryptophan 2,3-dioxygenase [Flavobacteriales bacterium]HRN36429.1 tryptophan 2,3-dioxygenase family protein [Flavobacteriales bacterium]HRO38822.1 tryptophan 2,3-dioxygenase family protein [Flavobacteriales bacterium]HRP82466.1 tryptophan 2,3-dioxygenase family protein [Flavobacteriales bacterium]HRQ85008.1 tryptophan 2,3-dioxygenase family protein [Flavobacteriales bacterium]
MSNVYYPDYLQLERLLSSQELESDKLGQHAHDEMLFIIIHQAYELWFKQLLYEVGSVIEIFEDGQIDDNAGELNIAVHRMRRVNTIVDLLVKQLGILDTMTPLDFLDFRDMLRPASGFQSMQFKILEARLGLRMEDRFGKQYYTSQLHPEHKAQIEALENKTTLVELVNAWLERMPFLDPRYWPGKEQFFDRLGALYVGSLVKGEEQNAELWKEIFVTGGGKRKFSAKAARSGLFIMMYRDQPLFQQPFRFLDSLVELDNGMARWRARHVDMVHRMIGLRLGTGGSTGKGYLRGAMDHHYVFKELADLGSFLFERRKLPPLPAELRKAVGFAE